MIHKHFLQPYKFTKLCRYRQLLKEKVEAIKRRQEFGAARATGDALAQIDGAYISKQE